MVEVGATWLARLGSVSNPDDAPATRPLRADAQRNYERLIVAARDVFAKQGGSASMEAIAREAGVGVGTLYRHFPQRIDVVEAVYCATTSTSSLQPPIKRSRSSTRGQRSWRSSRRS